MKVTKKQIVFTILAILWMATIFYFSSRTADESTTQSEGVSFILGNIIYKDFNEWPLSEQIEFADSISNVVRKGAHMTEYAILFILWFNAFGSNIPIAFAIAVLYASTDEFHQRFVKGRTGKVEDVLIDACGALIAVIITEIIILIKKKKGA